MTDHPLIDFATVNGGPIAMNGPYSQEFPFFGGPLNGTRQKVPLDYTTTKGYFPPDTYRVGQIPALGSPGSSDAHFKVHSYRRCEERRTGVYYMYTGPGYFPDDEQPDPIVTSFYERMEVIAYVGAVVIGMAIAAGLWFLVNGG